MKCFSLFAGIGGFDLAAQSLGHQVVGACEIDGHSRSVYARHFPKVKIWQDATKLNPKELPSFDLLTAGFPCQAFSIAGHRLGFAESRGTLFFEIARIARQKRPRFLLLENVKGLLSHDNGRTFETILKTLDEIGYDAEWQVLDSQYFVPQSRARIYIVGHSRDQSAPQVFPITEINRLHDPTPQQASKPRSRVWRPHCRAIDANYAKGVGSRTMLAVPITDTGNGTYQGKNIRALTPLECERLQGFPDHFTRYGQDGNVISDIHRYRMIGNAVTVPVIRFIMERLS